jgi:ATP-dependent Clp protease ATP-binding subunit ClpA
MFEQFTERAKKVMSFSRQEASRLGSEFIGTEHILLGIVREGGGVGANVLKNLRIDLERVGKEVEKLLKPDPNARQLLGQLPFSPRAKRVIELAGEAASQLRHEVIGTEHLLLGLLKENEGIAAQVLINLGLKLADVRDMVLKVLGDDVDLQKESTSVAIPRITKTELQGRSTAVEQVIQMEPHFDSSALTSQEKAEMIVSAWLARGGQESIPNHTDHLTKLIAWAIEASKRGA